MLHCPQIPAALRRDADETKARRARMEARAWHPPTLEPVDNPVSEDVLAEKEAETVLEVDLAPPASVDPDPAPWVPPKVHEIVRVVAGFYGIRPIDILSARRTRDVVRPRQVVMHLARTLTLRSLPEIGRALGGRDHTTALHGSRKIARLLLVDDVLRNEVAILKAALGVVEWEDG